MIAVGIDIGKQQHVAWFLDNAGKTSGPSLRFPNAQNGVDRLVERLQHVTEPIIIGMEASGHYWRALHAALSDIGDYAASHSGTDGQPVLLAALYHIAEEAEDVLASLDKDEA